MLTITVMNEAGDSVAHTDPAVITSVVGGWLVQHFDEPKPLSHMGPWFTEARVLEHFCKAMTARDYESAAIHAAQLGISLGVTAAPATQPTYIVPVDPADETNCEACQ